MKAFVIKAKNQEELETLLGLFYNAGIESDLDDNLEGDFDCIGTLNGELSKFGAWYYLDHMFDNCKHFSPAQFDECLKYIRE